MMSAYDELVVTGRLGPQGVRLLYRVVQVVALARNFPPPVGHVRWDTDAAADAAHDFLDGKRGSKRLTDLALRATDEKSFERLLHGAVVNFHRDRSRQTELGALVRRAREVLERSVLFEPTPSDPVRWRTVGGPDKASGASPASLSRAAAEEPHVDVPRWSSSKRRAPQADFASFERLVQRVLSAADGSLTAAEIARAISARLGPYSVPLTLELDVLERLPDRGLMAQTEIQVLSRMHAADLFAQLSDRERTLLAAWDRPVRDLGELLGVRHSQAHVLRQRLAARLKEELDGDPDVDVVVSDLLALATGWLVERTTGPGAALVHRDETRRRTAHGIT
jgi:hypothetical protein